MRELTFAGFVREYLLSLSGGSSLALKGLATDAAGDNPRLKEPLLLYALTQNKGDTLLRMAKSLPIYNEYAMLIRQLGGCLPDETLGKNLWPERYQKVWRTFQSQKNRFQTDEETKKLMRKRLMEVQQRSGLSNYRIYHDLHLNPGNVNSWLKHDDSSKVSLATARRALQYAKSLAAD